MIREQDDKDKSKIRKYVKIVSKKNERKSSTANGGSLYLMLVPMRNRHGDEQNERGKCNAHGH